MALVLDLIEDKAAHKMTRKINYIGMAIKDHFSTVDYIEKCP